MRAALVFDLDGTLIDSAPDIHAAAARMLYEFGHPPLSAAVVQGFIGNGAPKLVERVMTAVGAAAQDHGQWFARFLHHYEADPATLTRPYPGVPEALAALTGAGHAMGLCTNKPEVPARAILAHFGLDRHFAAVVGGDTIGVTKPDPRPLAHLMAALPPGPRLYIGDSEVDAETARAVGVPFALFTEGYRKTPVEAMPHDFAFSRFDELPALVARVLETGA